MTHHYISSAHHPRVGVSQALSDVLQTQDGSFLWRGGAAALEFGLPCQNWYKSHRVPLLRLLSCRVQGGQLCPYSVRWPRFIPHSLRVGSVTKVIFNRQSAWFHPSCHSQLLLRHYSDKLPAAKMIHTVASVGHNRGSIFLQLCSWISPVFQLCKNIAVCGRVEMSQVVRQSDKVARLRSLDVGNIGVIWCLVSPDTTGQHAKGFGTKGFWLKYRFVLTSASDHSYALVLFQSVIQIVAVLLVVSSYFVFLEEKKKWAEPSRERRNLKISHDYLQVLRREVNAMKLVDSDD